MKTDGTDRLRASIDWAARRRQGITHLLAAAALGGWFLVRYLLTHSGAVCPDVAAVAADTISICQAIVGSWIFYFIVVRLKEISDARNVEPCVKRKVADLIDIHHDVISKITEVAGDDAHEAFPSIERAKEYFDAISTKDQDRVEGLKCFLLECKDRMIEWHNLLYKVVYHLDSEFILILTDIEDGRFAHGRVMELDAFLKYQANVGRLLAYAQRRFGLSWLEAIDLARHRDY